jgi:Protein of unknown function with HXXEE motif
MEWIFPAFLAASIVHMLEEYIFPGGFMRVMRGFNPRFAPYMTVPMAVAVNGLQLLLCAAAILVGVKLLPFSLSVAGLLFVNGWVHILGSFRLKRYVPGAISGTLLYIPLSVAAYAYFLGTGELMLRGLFVSVILGVLYQLIPIGYLALASALKRA